MQIRQIGKIDSLQVLRGVAAILVVLFHLGGYINQYYKINFYYPSFKFGYSGVDFFFVLSGFIISYSSSKLINHPDQLKSFAWKRLCRVLPIYWIIITFILCFSLVLPSAFNSKYVFSLLNVLNTFLVLPEHPKVLIISWTLSHEIFFYTLFALMILSVRFIYIIIPIVCLSLLNTITSKPFTSDPIINFISSSYNLEFMMGVIAFYFSKYINQKWIPLFLPIGLILFIISCNLIDIPNFNRILFFGVPSFFILIGIVFLEKIQSINIPSFFILLGDASYMIYLIHYPLISGFNKIGVKIGITKFMHPLTFNLLVFIFIIVISIILYKAIEKLLLKKLYHLGRSLNPIKNQSAVN